MSSNCSETNSNGLGGPSERARSSFGFVILPTGYAKRSLHGHPRRLFGGESCQTGTIPTTHWCRDLEDALPFKSNSKIDVLKRVSLFSACSDKELGQVGSLVDETNASAGTVLTKEGSPGREFFAIIEGTAKVTLRDEELATLGPGSFFGEMSLLDQGPRTATVTATSDMRLYVLDARSFATLLDQHPAVARKILRGLAGRLRELEKAPHY